MNRRIQFRRIELHGFGRLGGGDPFALEFEPGLNAILGPNEAGKSTLLSALFALLFGIYDAKERERRRPWNPRAIFGGALDFTVNEKHYCVTQDFDNASAALERLETGAAVEPLFNGGIGKSEMRGEAQAWRAVLHDVIGSASAEFLRNANFVRQALLEVSLPGEVERVISGLGQGGMDAARERLNRQYRELTSYDVFTQGHLKKSVLIEKTEQRLREWRERESRLAQTEQSWGRLIVQSGEIERELEADGRELKDVQAQYKVLDAVEQANRGIRRCLDKIQDLSGERARRDLIVKQIEVAWVRLERDYRALRNAPEDLEETLNAIDELSRQANFLEQTLAEKTAERSRVREQRDQLEQERGRRFAELRVMPPEFLERVKRLQELLKEAQEAAAQAIMLEELLGARKRELRRWKLIGASAGIVALIFSAMAVAAIAAPISYVALLTAAIGCVFAGWKFFHCRADFDSRLRDLSDARSRGRQLAGQIAAFPPEFEKFRDRDLRALGQAWQDYRLLNDQIDKLNVRLEDDDATLGAELRRSKSELAAARARAAEFLADDDIGKTRRMLREFRELQHDAKTHRNMLKVSHRPAEEISAELSREQAEYRRQSDTLDEILHAHPEARPLQDHPADLAGELKRLRERVAQLTQKIDANKERQIQIRGELAQLCFDDGDGPAALRERIREEAEQLDRMKARCAALETALRAIDECKQEFSRLHLERLAEKTAAQFGAITRNNYRGVQIAPDFALRLSSAERVEIDVEELSRGTRDQLFLALRFALARELAGDAIWPLLLDDPFVHCDAERRAAIRVALHQLAEEHQVLLFSHDDQYQHWGHTLNLEL